MPPPQQPTTNTPGRASGGGNILLHPKFLRGGSQGSQYKPMRPETKPCGNRICKQPIQNVDKMYTNI